MIARDAWLLYWGRGESFQQTAFALGTKVPKLRKFWKFWGFPRRKPGPRSAPRKLTPEQTEDILRSVYEGGRGQSDLARDYGVSRQRISQIVREAYRLPELLHGQG